MEMNIVRCLMQHDIDVAAYNRSADTVGVIKEEGTSPRLRYRKTRTSLHHRNCVLVVLSR